MGQDYIPARDYRAAAWFYLFGVGISADPAGVGVSAAEAAGVVAAAGAYRAALKLARQPATRTVVSVAAKNEARARVTALCRPLAQRIRVNEAVADSVKVGLGLHLVNRKKRRIKVAAGVPLLGFQAAWPGEHRICFQDSRSPSRRAKPRGAAALQLFMQVGDGADPVDVKGWRYCGTYTRSPITVRHDPALAGERVRYVGRWISRRGEEGAFGVPVGAGVAA